VLIDTPGLNDPMQIRNTITLKQALVADTLVFVLRADKIGTESERAFLEDAIKKGKLSELLLVITHSDSVQTPTESLKEMAKKWLRRVPVGDASSDMSRLLYGAQIFVIDARSGQGYKASDEEFDNFIAKLSLIADKSAETEYYVTRAREKRENLADRALAELDQFLSLGGDNRYNELLTENLLDVIKKLEELRLQCEEQIKARITMMRQKHAEDFQTIRKFVEQCQTMTQTDAQTAIVHRVNEFGKQYSDKNNWKNFNDSVLVGLIHKSTVELEKEINRIFTDWGTLITEFAQELADEFKTAFSHFPEIRQHYESVCNSPGYILSLCKASNTFDAIDKGLQKTALIAAGAAGTAVMLRPLLLIGLVASIPVVGWVATGVTVGTYALIKASNFLDTERAREKFIDNKIKEANKVIARQFEQFDEAIYAEFAKIEKVLLENSLDLYKPLLNQSLASCRDLKFQIQVMQRIQRDTKDYGKRLLAMNE
jgi:GTPase Era involved in 16S rRNA processing